jgi:hypothetical protein
MPVAAPSPGLIPHASPRVPNLSERGPDGRKHFFGSPKTVPPNKCLRPGLCAPLTERHGWHGVSPKPKGARQWHTAKTRKHRKRETTPPALIAWHVSERGENKFWNRIGAAWEHKDGDGLTLQLDLIPVTGGRIVLRAPKQEEEGA